MSAIILIYFSCVYITFIVYLCICRLSKQYCDSPGATEDAINAAREAFHAYVASTQKTQQHTQDTSEEDLSLLDEREIEVEFAGT